MRTKLCLAICLLWILIPGMALAEETADQGAASTSVPSDEIGECLKLQHGLMLSCIQKGLGMMKGEELKMTSGKGPQKWEAPTEAAQEANPVTPDAASIEKGKAIYSFNCQACHGPNGLGDGPTAQSIGIKVANLTDPAVKERTDGALMWKITEGGWPMPAFGLQESLSREDIWHVINYLRFLSSGDWSK